MRTYIIAEAGSCHDKSVAKALDLIDEVRSAGADAVKFQWWSSANRLAARRNAPDYRGIYLKYAMPFDWLPGLKEHAEQRGLDFICTTYLPEDVERITSLGVHTYKVASFEANDPELLAAHVEPLAANVKHGVIISMGMGADYAVVWQSLHGPLFERGAQPARQIRYLHCVSAYPAPAAELNLSMLHVVDRRVDGFSDHAEPGQTWTGALAVAAGASILERHVRLDDTFEDNPDAPHAMKPRAFREYVRHVRYAEEVLGDGQRGSRPCEDAMRAYRVWRER